MTLLYMAIFAVTALALGFVLGYLLMPFDELPPYLCGYGDLRKKKVCWFARYWGPELLGIDEENKRMFLGWCEDHGYYIDYEHGFAGRTYIRCPHCMDIKRPTRATRVIKER